MAQFYDEDGNPVKAFDEKEVEAEKTKAAEEAKAALSAEQKEKIDGLEKQLADLKEKPPAGKPEEQQDQKKREEDLQKKIDEAKNAGLSAVLDTFREEALTQITGADAETTKKVKEQYELLTMPANSKAEIQERVRAAYLLATKNQPPANAFTPPVGPGGGPGSIPGGGGMKDGSIPQDVLDLGARMGYSKEDIIKFTPKK